MTLFKNGRFYLTAKHAFVQTDLLCDGQGFIVELPYSGKTKYDDVIDLSNHLVIPGLVDVHTHGRFGFDFATILEERMPTILKNYAQAGTAVVFPTLASSPYEEMIKATEMIRSFYQKEEGWAIVEGLHVEGRYLSPERRGAHALHLLSLPNEVECKEFLAAFHDAPIHFSLAPELEGAESFVRTAVELGATVGIAHTNDSYEHAMEAIRWGASSFTHTYNAMSPMHHREPGVTGASLLSKETYSEFICDGEHIHPSMINLAYQMKPKDRFVLITDSMEATGMPDGQYAIAGQKVLVKNGKALTEDGKLAGSTLTLMEALRNVMAFCNIPLEEAVPLATLNPARMVKIDHLCGSLEVGKKCHLNVLSDGPNYSLLSVFVNGKEIIKN